MTKKHELKDPERIKELLSQMLLIRRFEESTVKGYQQKKIAGFLHTYIGQEAVGVGTLAHKQAQDAVSTTYRCHGLGLAMGMDPNACMAELFGKITGCARGKGGSMHFFDAEKNFLGGHGIVGGQYGPGIGAAFQMKYKKNNGVSLIFFGEGALPQGTFHENMNLAALWNLPAIFICEDNQYGMGTANHRALSNIEISEFANSYKIKGHRINGMDLFEVHEKMGSIIEEVRKTNRPALVHMVTYRYMGHSVSDAGLYRSKEEVNEWKERDVLKSVSQHCIDKGILTESEFAEMDKTAKEIAKQSIAFADESPLPPLEELTLQTYAQPLEVQ
jgi:pyruvate dehydrogenase E1 component alpha subunit